jgi:2-polyprenyl-3-methyl-5-hydroxy-6-metoxy-1,4-benzoquinol methylase
LVADSIPFFAPELAGVFDGQSGYDPNGLAGLQEAEDEHFWFVPRRRLVLALIERYAPEARNLLEIGCGTGATLLAIARSRRWDALFGSDIHPNGLQATKRRVGSRTTLVQLDARNIPARNAFDVICALDVIEHIEQDETVLRSMHGALTDEGIVVLAVPQHSFLWSKYDVSTGHVRRYAPRELDQKVAKAGFDVLFSGSYTAILLPLMYLSRLRFRKGADDEITELRPAGMLNWLLKTALQAEVTATLAGLRFPFGGSRFVVAKKLSSRIRASG